MSTNTTCDFRALRWMIVVLLVVQAGAQAPTGQTQISLRASAYHNTHPYFQYGTPDVTLSAQVTAEDHTVAPDSSYASDHYAVAYGSVNATSISLYSWSRALAQSLNVFYSASAGASADASAIVPFRVQHPGLTGTQGTMVVPLYVSGAVALDPGFYDANTGSGRKGRAYVYFWASGLGAANAGTLGGNGALDIVSDYTGTHVSGNGANGTWMMNLSFTFGEWSSYHLQLWTRAEVEATAKDYGGFVQAFAESDYANTLRWGGISAVLDANGQPVTGWTAESVPGVDLTVAAVPEPSGWGLMAAGLAVMATWAILRRSAA